MRRKNITQVNIWPGFVDAITTLLLVFVFLLAVFMISQTFFNSINFWKGCSITKPKKQFKKLDADLDKNIVKNKKLSELIATLNQQIEILNLEKSNLETNLEDKEKLNKKYQINTKELESKIAVLFEELGIEKLNLKTEKEISKKLNLEMSELNKTISELNNKLSELDKALSLSVADVEIKEYKNRKFKR